MSQIGSISSGGGGGGVASVTGGSNITITGTATNPIVNLVNSPSVSGSVTAGTGLIATTGGVTSNAGGLNVIAGTTTINDTGAASTSIGGTTSTGTIDIGTSTGDQSINIGFGLANKGIRIGVANGTSSVSIESGSGNFTANSVGGSAAMTGSTGSSIDAAGGTIGVGAGNSDVPVNIGTLATAGRIISIGNATGTTGLVVNSGSSGVKLASGVASVAVANKNYVTINTATGDLGSDVGPTGSAAGCSFNASVDGTGNTIPAGMTQLLVFNNVNYNNGTNFTTNNTFTAPATALYYFNFQFDTSAAALTDLVFLYLNGAPVALTRNFQVVTPGAQFNEVTLSIILPLTVGDAIQCYYQNTGAVDAVIAGGFAYPGQQQSWFEGYKLT